MGHVIPKLMGCNNPDFPLYVELVHQEPARIAGLGLGHYVANGPVGTPAEIAAIIVRTGQVRPGETLWWDVEDWPKDGVTRWSPDEVIARASALESAGITFKSQGIYLNQSLANNGGYKRTGLKLWLAAYTDGAAVLVRGGWRSSDVELWQFTSDGIPATRAIYDDILDVNRSGSAVWDVWELQEALGFTGDDIDGDYGRVTTRKVKDFQASVGLDDDGDAGPKTLTALAKEFAR